MAKARVAVHASTALHHLPSCLGPALQDQRHLLGSSFSSEELRRLCAPPPAHFGCQDNEARSPTFTGKFRVGNFLPSSSNCRPRAPPSLQTWEAAHSRGKPLFPDTPLQDTVRDGGPTGRVGGHFGRCGETGGGASVTCEAERLWVNPGGPGSRQGCE